MISVSNAFLGAPFNPYRLQNNAAIYSLRGGPSDNTYLLNGANVKLIADRSRNSSVNGLVLNGVAGNYASAPDAAPLDIIGNLDLRALVAPDSVTPAADNQIIAKWVTAANASYGFGLENTTGKLRLIWSTDGTAVTVAISTVALNTVSVNFATIGLRATLTLNNGGFYEVRFYTSTDFVTWTQLGTTVIGGAPTTLFSGSSLLQMSGRDATNGMFAGKIYRAQVYNGINGTLAFDADFSRQAKLAASFVESSANAATVTVVTVGDFGARICGDRDLVNMTDANRPVLSVSGGYSIATFNGTAQIMKAAPFNLAQPESVYFVGSQITWTINEYLFDGNATQSGAVIQTTATPQLNLHAGSSVAANTTLAVATKAAISAIFNGANSVLGVNQLVATTGNAGAANMGGFTVGSAGTPGTYGNITFLEAIIRNVADPTPMRLAILKSLMKTCGIP